MRTSATGADAPLILPEPRSVRGTIHRMVEGHARRSAPPPRRFASRFPSPSKLKKDLQAGFTLIELMVVLMIMGLAAGAVVLAMPDPRGDLRHDAERFAARLHAARDKAILDSRDMAVVVDAYGYSFEHRARGRWIPEGEKAFAAVRWSEGAQAIVGTAGNGRAVLDATGLAEPIDVALLRDAARVSIRMDADGAIRVAP